MLVVDCTAVVDALTGAPGADLLHQTLAGERLAAPQLLDVEVASALRGLALTRHITAPRAEDAFSDFQDLSIDRWPTDDTLRRRAFQLRHDLSAYDAAYVALAEALDCPLLTRDRRLESAVKGMVSVLVR